MNHLFIIIENESSEYFAMLISSNLNKLKYNTNELIRRNEENNLDKDSVVKIDVLYRIKQKNILFKVGSVDERSIEKYKIKYLEL